MTDIGLAAAARGCPKLRHVGVGECVRLTDASIRALAEHARAGLRVLDVSGCRRVTDGGEAGKGGVYDVGGGGRASQLLNCWVRGPGCAGGVGDGVVSSLSPFYAAGFSHFWS